MTQVLNKPAQQTPTLGSTEPSDRLWTREEYYKLVEQGFFDGQRVELIEGRIVELAPQRVPHRVSVELVDRYAGRAFPAQHCVRVQMPFRAADGSDPEPDVAVVPGDPRDSTVEHPSRAVLIVEVSESTLRHDRRKARLYAMSGVTDYWIINLIDRCLERHRDPLPGGGSPNGPAYASVKIYTPQESIAPLAAPAAMIAVAELLP
jgi:Uma2 family endonuclease